MACPPIQVYKPIICHITALWLDRVFLTWELSAGVNYKASDKLSVDLGARYAGFPHAANTRDINGNAEIAGMDWRAFGFFAGVHF